MRGRDEDPILRPRPAPLPSLPSRMVLESQTGEFVFLFLLLLLFFLSQVWVLVLQRLRKEVVCGLEAIMGSW